MIETRCLKNLVIFFQAFRSFVLARKIISVYNDLARKHGNFTVKDFPKYEKVENKKNKLKLEIDFLKTCKQLRVYLNFHIFKLANVSNKDPSSIRKRLPRSTINNHKKELQHVLKELSISENFISKQLSTIDFGIVKTQQEIAAEIVIYSTQKIIITGKELQLTYIHS